MQPSRIWAAAALAMWTAACGAELSIDEGQRADDGTGAEASPPGSAPAEGNPPGAPTGETGTVDGPITGEVPLATTSSLATGELAACQRLYAYKSGARYYRVFELREVALVQGEKYRVQSVVQTTSTTTTNIMLGYYYDATLNGVPQGVPPSSVVSGENHTGTDTNYATKGQMPLAGHWLFTAPTTGLYTIRLWGRTASTASCQAAPTDACAPSSCGPISLRVLTAGGASSLTVSRVHANAFEERSHQSWVAGKAVVRSGAPVTFLNAQRLIIPAGMTKADVTALIGTSSTTASETVRFKLRMKKTTSAVWTDFPSSTGKTYVIGRDTHHKKVSLAGTLTGLQEGDEVQMEVIATLAAGSAANLDTGYYDPSQPPATGGIYGTYTIPPQTALIAVPKP
jgi:hypothetical protein